MASKSKSKSTSTRSRKTTTSKPRAAETGGLGASATGKDASALADVQSAVKLDTAAPESPVVADPEKMHLGEAEPKDVKIKEGDTVAAHEAHVLLNSDARVAERVRLESGPDGLPTDVIARRQQEDALRSEQGRISGDGRLRGAGSRQAAAAEAA